MILKKCAALCGVLALMTLSVHAFTETTVEFKGIPSNKIPIGNFPEAWRKASYVIHVDKDLYRCVRLTDSEKKIIIAAIKSDTKIKSYDEKIDQKLIDRLVKNNKANGALITKVFTDFKGKTRETERPISDLYLKMTRNTFMDAPWEAL